MPNLRQGTLCLDNFVDSTYELVSESQHHRTFAFSATAEPMIEITSGPFPKVVEHAVASKKT